MAINILGRFLLNRDNNIRYVALNTLCECVSSNRHAIQRHRNTIVECLKVYFPPRSLESIEFIFPCCLQDADVSIRRRALDLTYALVNKSNVRQLVSEMVGFLEVSHTEREFKSDLADKITIVVERYAG